MLNKDDPELFRESDYFKSFLRYLRKNKIALINLYLFIFMVLLVFLGNLIAPYSAETQFAGLELMPPSWDDKGQIAYFLGTDDLGRDIFSRLLAGFYYTLGSALLISISIAILGGIIGLISATSKRSFVFLGHLFDTFLFIPILIIAIIIATLMESGLLNAILAISLAMLPHFIHKIYLAAEQELKREYVVTLKLDGANRWFLIKEVLLPNLTPIAVKETTHIMMVAVLDISALSFIGLGAKSPTPEWGAMIRDSMELIYIAPWTVILPGITSIIVMLTISMLGDSISHLLQKYRH